MGRVNNHRAYHAPFGAEQPEIKTMNTHERTISAKLYQSTGPATIDRKLIREATVTVPWFANAADAIEKLGDDVVMSKGVNGNGLVVDFAGELRRVMAIGTVMATDKDKAANRKRLDDAALTEHMRAYVPSVGRTKQTKAQKTGSAMRELEGEAFYQALIDGGLDAKIARAAADAKAAKVQKAA